MRIKVILFGPPGRGSFNESGLAGVERARAAGVPADVIWVQSDGPAMRAARLMDICLHGADLVVLHGGQGDYPVTVVADRFPHIHFVIIQGSYTAPNAASYEVLQEQSAFLAGVAAAAETRSGVVGHLSGERIRPGLKGRAAYVDGVLRQRPDTALLTTFCGNPHDPELAFDTFAAMAARQADTVFAMIDGGRDGAIDACRAFGVRQIGNVLDWTERHPDVFLASAIANCGRCIETAILDFYRGAVDFGAKTVFGLDQPDYVRLILNDSVCHEARVAVDDWAQRLLDGTVLPADQYYGEEFEPMLERGA
ncbi:hypothetical protein GCM10023144_07950 [Pigmentiphaga soli]|uniref:ABC transporter substrate-binding protein PnrA-like domain-containing protein n=1 Tax=Pigmentiphaga soli TaxID=1007095 RepID=A0ABP8GJI4_9BURK